MKLKEKLSLMFFFKFFYHIFLPPFEITNIWKQGLTINARFQSEKNILTTKCLINKYTIFRDYNLPFPNYFAKWNANESNFSYYYLPSKIIIQIVIHFDEYIGTKFIVNILFCLKMPFYKDELYITRKK